MVAGSASLNLVAGFYTYWIGSYPTAYCCYDMSSILLDREDSS